MVVPGLGGPWTALEHFLMHEAGHAIGLGHPNERVWANFDSDQDPLTPVLVDPYDPASGLAVSPNVDFNAMMLGGFPPDAHWFSFTDLHPDDLAGRDVLYPSLVPEPGAAVLMLSALTLAAWRRSGRLSPN